MDSSSISSLLTRRSHPTALALFDAFERNEEENGKKKGDLVQKRTKSLGWRSRYSQVELYPVCVAGNSFSVKQVQRGEVEGTYGTGATVWPASMVLIKYLEKNPEKIRGQRVVELGAGTGVASIAAAYLGAKEVICTDGIECVVELAGANVRRAKELPITITTKKYWWGDGSLVNACDVVLVSDCVLPKLYPIAPLVKALKELMTSSSVAIVSYEHRHYQLFHPSEKFRELCLLAGLVVRPVPVEEQHDLYEVDDIELWLVTRARSNDS